MTRIAIDWGSTSFRAYRFDDHGALQDTLALPAGIKTAQNLEAAERSAWFEKTLLDAVGQWLGSGESLLLSGMITSRNGFPALHRLQARHLSARSTAALHHA